MSPTKECCECGQRKPLSQFKEHRPGRVPARTWTNVEHGTHSRRCLDCHRIWASCKQFGITVADYWRMHDAQRGVCAICKRPETRPTPHGGPPRLSIDHHHGSGRVRGLLCTDCNTALGKFKDDPAIVKMAAAYLQLGHDLDQLMTLDAMMQLPDGVEPDLTPAD